MPAVSQIKSRAIIFSLTCLLLLVPFQAVGSAVDIDDFPIGLFLEYDSWTDIFQPPLAYGDAFFYEFTNWVEGTMDDVVNCTCMTPSGNETRIDYFYDIRVDFAGSPPMLADVSSWMVGGVAWLGDDDYNISNRTTYRFGDSDLPCFRLVNITWANGLANTTSLFYDSRVGVLLSMFRETITISNSTLVAMYYFSLSHSNHLEFIQTPGGSTTIILRAGLIGMIAIEIGIIAILLKRRRGDS